MSRAVPPVPSTPKVLPYLVVTEGPSRGGVLAGPYPRAIAGEKIDEFERETDASLAAELLTREEAQEMAL